MSIFVLAKRGTKAMAAWCKDAGQKFKKKNENKVAAYIAEIHSKLFTYNSG